MSETFSIIFRGDILPGHTLPDVKARMAQLFKLDDAKLAMVFSGKPVALKKDCDADMAEKLRTVLTKAGAEIEVRSNTLVSAPVTAAPAPSTPISPPPPIQPKPVVARVSVVAQIPVIASTGDGLKIAPVGLVLTEAERAAQRPAPVQVDTSHISLKKEASVFGAKDDVAAKLMRPEIQAPVFDVFAAGADLLKPEEKKVVEELQLDLSAYQVSELGADLVSEEDKLPLPVMEIEELNAELAPAGSDMGQVKKAPPPPPPKVDHLSLA